MKTFKQHILEKLKVTKSSYKMTLAEFAKERQSLNDPKNDVVLTSNYKMVFINWAEKMLVEDGIIVEDILRIYGGHIMRFDGDILYDNVDNDEIDPAVSTEIDLRWGEAYMRIVIYYIKNNIFKTPLLVAEKLKVSKTPYEDITFEKFIDEFQKMNNPTIYFERYLDLIDNDYPSFKSYPGMSAEYNNRVGKKFKYMYLVRNTNGQIELQLGFKRSVDGTTGIAITNTDELYNYLGAEQVYTLYDLIKELVEDQ